MFKKVKIREGDPSADREVILSVLERNLPRAGGGKRYDWRYLANPAGKALVWVAENDKGEVVGTSAAHPRRMRLGDAVVDVLNLGDFAIDTHLRSVGPALQLMRATLEPLNAGRFAFAYDHCNEAMFAVHKRLGGRGLASIVRYARPLRATPMFERRWGKGIATRVLGGLGDLVLRAKDALCGVPSGYEVSTHEGEFGEEFDALAERLYKLRPVVGLRTAEYLTWRFARHALWRHEAVCARRDGELVGCVVVQTADPRQIGVMELIADDDPPVLQALTAGLLALGRSRGAGTLSAPVLAGGPAGAMLERMGFSERESSYGPIIFVPTEGAPAIPVTDAAQWWMVEGDRDV